MAGLAIAGSATQVAQNEQQKKAADRKGAAEQIVFNRNRDIAEVQAIERRTKENARITESNKGFGRQVARVEKKISQLRSANAENEFDKRNEYVEARGALLAAAGNSSGGGVSISDQQRAFGFKQGRGASLRLQNFRNQVDAWTDNLEDLHAGAVSNAQNFTPAPFLENGIIPTKGGDTTLGNIGAVLEGAAGVAGAARTTPKPATTNSTLFSSSGLQLGGGQFVVDPTSSPSQGFFE
jgi:hypothetical protein